MKNGMEYEAECPSCETVYVSEVPWISCPACARRLRKPNSRSLNAIPGARKNRVWGYWPGFGKQAYTVAEVSELMGFSQPTVIKLFEKEPGVLIIARPEKMNKRKYRSIRIPRAVYERVVRRFSV